MAFPYTFEEIIAACRAPGVKAVDHEYGGDMNDDGRARLCPLCCLIAARDSIEDAMSIAGLATDVHGDTRICDRLGITLIQEAGFIQGVDGGERNLPGFEYDEAYEVGVQVRKAVFGEEPRP